jgi:hypothetical protein
MAGNLGYKTSFVIDATDAFDLNHADGAVTLAPEVMRMTAANLDRDHPAGTRALLTQPVVSKCC